MARVALTPPPSPIEAEDELKKASKTLLDALGVIGLRSGFSEHPLTVFRNHQAPLVRLSYYVSPLSRGWERVLTGAKPSVQGELALAKNSVHTSLIESSTQFAQRVTEHENIAEFTALLLCYCHSRSNSESYVYSASNAWDKWVSYVLSDEGTGYHNFHRTSPYDKDHPFEMVVGRDGKDRFDHVRDIQNEKRIVLSETVPEFRSIVEEKTKISFHTEGRFIPHGELLRIFENKRSKELLKKIFATCLPRVAAKNITADVAFSLLMEHHGLLKTFAVVVTRKDALIPTSLLWQNFAEYLAAEDIWFQPDSIPSLRDWREAFGQDLSNFLHTGCSQFWPAVIRPDVTLEVHDQPPPILHRETIMQDGNSRIYRTVVAGGASVQDDGTLSGQKTVFEKHIVTRVKEDPNELKIYRHLPLSSTDHKSIMKIIGCLYLGMEKGEHIYALYMDLAVLDLKKLFSEYRPERHMRDELLSPAGMLEEVCILIEGFKHLHDKNKVCLMDLHPGNIAVHLKRSNFRSRFVMVDFEHARILRDDGTFVVTDFEGPGAFSAPKLKIGQSSGFLSDNWSLGCIIVLILVWLHDGQKAIDLLYSEIQKEDGSDTFYKWEGETSVLKLAVRKALREATLGMYDMSDPENGTRFQKITRLLENHILCPQEKRISSAEIHSRFETILSEKEIWPRPSKDVSAIYEVEATTPIVSRPVAGSIHSPQRNTSSSPSGPFKDTPLADEVETTPPTEGRPAGGLIPSHQRKRPLSSSDMLAQRGTKEQRTK